MAKYQLQSKLPRREECKVIEGKDDFTLEFEADEELFEKVKEWMKYCGWKLPEFD